MPKETLDFAHRMFDAARDNNAELLIQAVDVGLPPNLTNDKGVCHAPFLVPDLPPDETRSPGDGAAAHPLPP